MHVPWSVRALEAGKHVLCEKPLTRRPAEVEEAFAAAERAGRVLEEAFMWRHHPQTLRLRELLDEGAIGGCGWSRRRSRSRSPTSADIRMQAGLDGGSLMDVGCYCVSGARLVAGAEPERVLGEQAIGGDGVDVAFAATLRFPGDVLGALPLRLRRRRRATTSRRSATRARCSSPTRGTAARPASSCAATDGVERIEIAAANPYTHELVDFARAVRGEAPPLLGTRGRARAGARDRGALRLGGARLPPTKGLTT